MHQPAFAVKDTKGFTQSEVLVSSLSARDSVLVQGDAGDVLAATAPLSGAARLVLIDPPYNRRTRFHHYDDSSPRHQWADERRRHLLQLHPLLAPDGSLWMHIDDAEMPRARVLLDEVFGASNFVATIVWQKTLSRDNRMAVSTTHEYILVYARDKRRFLRFRAKLPPTGDQLGRYSNRDGDMRGPWTSGDLTAKAGPGRRQAQFYDLTLPSGRVVRPATGTAWRYTKERLEELIADGRIDFGRGDKMPRLKRFLSEVDAGLVPDTWWSGAQVGTADSAKKHLKSLFPGLTPFETPKPEELAARIIEIASRPGDLVVDCYAGSGTTAAVAHKLGRQWLAIEQAGRTFSEFTLPRLILVDGGRDLSLATPAHSRVGTGFRVIRDFQPALESSKVAEGGTRLVSVSSGRRGAR